MTTQPTRRDQALDAAAQALNAGRYWLPAEAQAAVVDAVAAVYEVDLEASRRRTVALVERIDAARAWARQHLTVEQQTGLLGVLAGREDAAASTTPAGRPTDGLRGRYAAAIRNATCTGNCGTSETECARTRIQPVVWEHDQLAEVSGSPEMLADTILATRDTELDRMRADREQLLTELDGRDEEARERWIQKQLAETGIKSMDFRNGATMDIEPARDLVAQWVGAARAMLGDAPNYSETPIEMVVKVAEAPERFAFILQRVGKLTPHEARQQAEQRAEQAEADRDRWQHGLEAAEAQLVQLRRTVDRVRALAAVIRAGAPWAANCDTVAAHILAELEPPQDQPQ